MTTQAYQMVTCAECGRHYRCTPADDYYNATTATDGQCEICMLGGLRLAGTLCPRCFQEVEYVAGVGWKHHVPPGDGHAPQGQPRG